MRKYMVLLRTCGDINRGENPMETYHGIKNTYAQCDSIEDCCKQVQNFINEYGFGSANWNGGQIYDQKTDQYIGRINFNAKFYDKETEYGKRPDIDTQILNAIKKAEYQKNGAVPQKGKNFNKKEWGDDLFK